ncbi:MAG: RDD family protein [Mycobacterium sp.]
MTVAVDEVTEAADEEMVVPHRPAGWWTRAAAFAIDVLFPLGVATSLLLVGWSAPRGDWLWWVCLVVAALVVVAIAVNRWLLPANTGWSLGRSVLGIAVDNRDGSDPGAGRLALRDLAHVVDTVPFALGWLWPLLDARGRTFADMLARTEVCEVDGPVPDRRRVAAAVLAAAAALSVLAAMLGFGLVYRHQQSLNAARDQIAEQGPKLVSDMLSYQVKSVDDDFAHAQSLVTDGYRPEFTAQQDAVKKNGLVDNDYWVSNSSVVSSTTDTATMLLLLQGQRGAPPKQRFVTASVRVEYEKVGDDWKVANLTVLAAPKPPAPPADSGPKPDQGKPDQGKPAQPKPDQPKPSAGGR